MYNLLFVIIFCQITNTLFDKKTEYLVKDIRYGSHDEMLLLCIWLCWNCVQSFKNGYDFL